MAGTLFGLPLSIQMDSSGERLAGCKLYLYQAGTTTPTTAYEDFNLTGGLELPFPMVADASGRIPIFWLADGSYRARLVKADGVEIFDEDSITAIGASSGASAGQSINTDSIFATGDFLWQPISGTRSGWVRGNGRTIGNVASGATERANADTEDLFLHLWNNYSNSICPVSGGRGASPSADFAASKTIGTVDMRGCCPYGLDDMGSTAAGRIDTATSAARFLGAEEITIQQGNLPDVSLTGSSTSGSLSIPRYTLLDTINNGDGTSGTKENTWRGAGDQTYNISASVSVALGGSDTPIATLSPGRAGTWYIRL